MIRHRFFPFSSPALVAAALLSSPVFADPIEWVEIGNVGNPADSTGYGSVSYPYMISKFETTVEQYAEFLNAVAKSDPYELWNDRMMHSISAITRSGTDGNYTYSVISGSQRPIAHVTWFNAARFANWMHNGQGDGGTETGAYNLNGAMSGVGFNPEPGARFKLPTHHEWYKAAYYDPMKGENGGYWLYATRTDVLTSNRFAVPGAANFLHDGVFARETNGLSSDLSDVGSYTLSASYYGTYDQSGNVREWLGAYAGIAAASIRGGSWTNTEVVLRSTSAAGQGPSNTDGIGNVGFRLVAMPDTGSDTVSLDWVTIEDPANPADTNGVGAVSYVYNISKFETTVGQYAAFLNAVAKSDPYLLWNSHMAADPGGIFRAGSPGAYTYIAVGESLPISHVTWFNAARFVNWLHNGQGEGSTETGVYELNGAMEGSAFAPQEGATVWLPTEDEWYKAAYYDPTKDGTGGYWLHATRRDSLPGNLFDVAGAANYYHEGEYAQELNGLEGPTSDVGAYSASPSYYGTFDQAGNLREWLGLFDGESVMVRGGSWLNTEVNLASSASDRLPPYYTAGIGNVGFRVAGIPASDAADFRITGLEKTATTFTIRFQGAAGRTDWKVTASTDLVTFGIDETANSTITEATPGSYEAVVDLVGKPANYFLRIER